METKITLRPLKEVYCSYSALFFLVCVPVMFTLTDRCSKQSCWAVMGVSGWMPNELCKIQLDYFSFEHIKERYDRASAFYQIPT